MVSLQIKIAALLAATCPADLRVEEFVVASGSPHFGEEPIVCGNLICWQRYARGFGRSDMIECRDISRLDSPIVEVAPYPANRVGVVVGSEFLFRGSSNGLPGGSPVLATRIDLRAALRGTPRTDLLVSEFGRPVALSGEHLFIKTVPYEPAPLPNAFFAARLDAIGQRRTEEMELVATYRVEPWGGRTEAASDSHFVWIDRDPDVRNDTWKIYVKHRENLFTPGTERFVADTNVFYELGVNLDVHETLLVFQGSETKSVRPRGIYFVDLAAGKPPTRLASSMDREKFFQWPSISREYVAWTEKTGFFKSVALAVRIEDARPVGEPFPISRGSEGGSWLRIDGNIAVWNGSISMIGGTSVVAAELPLPGADDIGDVDQSGRLDLVDAVTIMNYLFRMGWKPRDRLADVDLDGAITLRDAVTILRYLFYGDALQ